LFFFTRLNFVFNSCNNKETNQVMTLESYTDSAKPHTFRFAPLPSRPDLSFFCFVLFFFLVPPFFCLISCSVMCRCSEEEQKAADDTEEEAKQKRQTLGLFEKVKKVIISQKTLLPFSFFGSLRC